MLEILGVATPVFVIIAVGFGAVRSGLVPSAWLPALGGFVVRLALPALLFKSLSQRSFAEVMNLRYLGAYALGALIVLGGGLLWGRFVRREPLEKSAMMALGMACSNSGYVGYPIALQVIGPVATVALALAMVIENMLMIPLGLALADSGGARHEAFHRTFGRALARLRTNPIIIAMVAGFVFTVFGLALPAPLTRAVDMFAAASAPVALFYIGGILVGLPLRGMFADIGAVAFGKLVLHPLIVCGTLLLFGPIDPSLAAGAVLLASAPMLSVYPIFGQKHGMQGFCAATLVVSTVTSFLTMSAAIWLLRAGGWA